MNYTFWTHVIKLREKLFKSNLFRNISGSESITVWKGSSREEKRIKKWRKQILGTQMLFPSRNNWYNWYNRYKHNRRGRPRKGGKYYHQTVCASII